MCIYVHDATSNIQGYKTVLVAAQSCMYSRRAFSVRTATGSTCGSADPPADCSRSAATSGSATCDCPAAAGRSGTGVRAMTSSTTAPASCATAAPTWKTAPSKQRNKQRMLDVAELFVRLCEYRYMVMTLQSPLHLVQTKSGNITSFLHVYAFK